jgi:hypothetical protein
VRSPWPDDDERGSVTAEFAVVLPAALVCLALGVGAIQLGGQHLRLVDAAAVDARLLGRGDAPRGEGAGLEAARTIEREGGLVCVTLTATGAVVGVGMAGLRASGRACALDESAETSEDGSGDRGTG